MKIAGLISGTSLDGIDVALCDVRTENGAVRARCERFATVPFAESLRARIIAAYPPAPVGALELSALHADIGEAFGDAVRTVAGDMPLDAVASHGVTLAHAGEAHHTLQLGDAFRIRERTGTTVIYDFRSADTAAGGTGAPLVPFVDALLFANHAPCVALNLGGIANLTVLPEGIAFDSGPANLPIDTYVTLRTNGAQRYDSNGKLAERGTANPDLLLRMLDDPYFAKPSTEVDRPRGVRQPVHHALAKRPRRAAIRRRRRNAHRTHGNDREHRNPRRSSARKAGDRQRRRRAQPRPGSRTARAAHRRARRHLRRIRRRRGCERSDRLRGSRLRDVARAYGGITARHRGSRSRVLGAIAPHELDALLERVRLEDGGGGLPSSG